MLRIVIEVGKKMVEKTYSSSKNVGTKNSDKGGKCESRRWYRRSNFMFVLFMIGGNVIRRIVAL